MSERNSGRSGCLRHRQRLPFYTVRNERLLRWLHAGGMFPVLGGEGGGRRPRSGGLGSQVTTWTEPGEGLGGGSGQVGSPGPRPYTEDKRTDSAEC